MTDYEHMIISAIRYALGRKTYIVELTINYALKDIEQNKLSNKCLSIIMNDIKYHNRLGIDPDVEQWSLLLNKIDTIINKGE